MSKPTLPSVRSAASAAIAAAGGGAALAERFNLTRYAVHLWTRTGIPARHVGHVAEIVGKPVHELRPDLFSAPASAAPSKPTPAEASAA